MPVGGPEDSGCKASAATKPDRDLRITKRLLDGLGGGPEENLAESFTHSVGQNWSNSIHYQAEIWEDKDPELVQG